MYRVSAFPLLGERTSHREALASQVGFLVIALGIAIPLVGNGRLLALHALLVLIGPVVLAFSLRHRGLRALWIVVALWSAAQLVSDLVHGLPIPSAVLLAGPTIAALASGLFWIHQRAPLSLPATLIAAGLGWIALEVIAGEAVASGNPWKFGFSTPVIVLALALAYRRRVNRHGIILLLIALAGVSLYFDSRTQTGLLLIAAAVVAALRVQSGQRKGSSRPLIVLLIAAAVAYTAYPAAAVSGLLGDRAQQQQLTYTQQDANFLLATRLEMPQMAYLSVRHFGLGVGSYNAISDEEANAALEFLDKNVAPLSSAQQSYLVNYPAGSPGYNTHSQALTSVLFAGFLAIPFWVYLGALIWRALRRLASQAATMPALLVFLSALSVWDALFSPYATRSHITFAITIFVATAVLNNSENATFDKPRDAAILPREA